MHKAIGSPLLMDPNKVCRRLRRLRGRRSRICRRQPEVVEEVHKGVAKATKECQFQFKDRRWNCSTNRRSLKKILLKDLKETAYVNAITSAGLVHAITAGCSRGHMPDCACEVPTTVRSPTVHPDWTWGGCSDNVHYGYRKARQFMEALFRRRADVKTLVMLHNNDVGRLAVRRHMRVVCKCHGLSGSCTLRTCWRKMPLFRDVGSMLLASYDKAARVVPANDGKSLLSASEGQPAPARNTLIFAERGPDFCLPNRAQGSLGTRGRRCNRASGNCRELCCGRGYNTRQMNVTENCNCRFQWCCEVHCDQCTVLETLHFCR
ncbi:Protein Wnt-6 [Amphibalanus amphitrite]|uniref:Protein Wnt n=1 Tax=Amphibalanus amphitrite TaxID=1232801 RepID=A0A6A4WS39_AMPAM|nr:Protein Wnt-6 [Amphibalanus amphitrite]